MTTNGSLLNKKSVSNLIDSKIDFISISLDGNEKDHDKGRGVKGAYRRVINGIKLLKKIRGKSLIPHIKLVGILNPEKPLSSLHVLKTANILGVDEVAFGHLMFYPSSVKKDQYKFIRKHKIGSSYITGMETSKKLNIDWKNLNKVIEIIKNNKDTYTSIVPSINLNIKKYYSYPYQYPSLCSMCKTPWFSAIIRPDGNVSPCMEFNIDNIKNKKFLEIWNSPKWKLFRKIKSQKKEKVPACFRCGEGQKFIFD